MRYRHILRDVDRYGNVRLYFRKKKGDPKACLGCGRTQGRLWVGSNWGK